MIFQMMRGYHLTLAVILSVFGVGQMTEEEYPTFEEENYPNFAEEEWRMEKEEYPNFDDGYVSLGQMFSKWTEC